MFEGNLPGQVWAQQVKALEMKASGSELAPVIFVRAGQSACLQSRQSGARARRTSPHRSSARRQKATATCLRKKGWTASARVPWHSRALTRQSIHMHLCIKSINKQKIKKISSKENFSLLLTFTLVKPKRSPLKQIDQTLDEKDILVSKLPLPKLSKFTTPQVNQTGVQMRNESRFTSSGKVSFTPFLPLQLIYLTPVVETE